MSNNSRQNAVGRPVDDDGTVHFRQLAQPGRGELNIEIEASRGDFLDRFIEAQDNNGAGSAAQDALEPIAKNNIRLF